MVEQLRIVVLVENTGGRPDVHAEHGLALWIETDERNILFDTGPGAVLAHNAEVLGVDLADAHDVVLSHGHYDHAGGLAAMPDAFGAAKLYAHPAAFDAKFSVSGGGTAHFAGSQPRGVEAVRQHIPNIVLTREPTRIAEGVWVTGEIPRRNSFEDTGGPFFLDESGRVPDRLIDDQALYVESAEGIVVLLGCAHAGVVNTLDYIADLSGQRSFRAVLGGMHLVGASEERVAGTIAALRGYDVRLIGPCHCTGAGATSRIMDAFPDRFLKVSTGSVILFH